MRPDEFLDIQADIQDTWWAFPVPANAMEQYGRDLESFAAEAVRAAIASLATDGLERPPTSGQIRRRVAEMELDAPEWEVVRTGLMRWRRDRPKRLELVAAWSCPAQLCEGDGFIVDREQNRSRECVCRPSYIAALRGLDTLPALVSEWIDTGHVDWVELERFLDDGDTTREAQVRRRWLEFSGRAVQSRIMAGLSNPGDVPRLTAARIEDEERHGELRRFSAVALLEQGPAA